jgi:hypothetical protein
MVTLDVDCQTPPLPPAPRSGGEERLDEILNKVNDLHLNVISRLNEIELINFELNSKLSKLSEQFSEFHIQYKKQTQNELEQNLLIKNLGLLK